jgi:hypothetical protein
MSGLELGREQSNITEIYRKEVHYTQSGGCRAQTRALMLLRP